MISPCLRIQSRPQDFLNFQTTCTDVHDSLQNCLITELMPRDKAALAHFTLKDIDQIVFCHFPDFCACT